MPRPRASDGDAGEPRGRLLTVDEVAQMWQISSHGPPKDREKTDSRDPDRACRTYPPQDCRIGSRRYRIRPIILSFCHSLLHTCINHVH
jgi:hypothetical protein